MSGGRGNLVEETHDLVQAPIVQSGEVSTFDRSICAFRSELPREPDVAAIAVRLANQCEAEGGEPLLHRTDKPINLVMAAALHERVNVSTVFGPESDQQSPSAVGIRFIPESDVAIGDQVASVMRCLLMVSWGNPGMRTMEETQRRVDYD